MPSPKGNGSIKGYLVRPASAGNNKLPGVLVVHENRGLNPHIEDVARRFALANFMAFAPDALTSVGGYPGDDDKGGELFGKVDRNKMTEDFVAAANWLKNRAGLHRQDRRDRLLLRRRHRQHARRSPGRRYRGGRAVLRRALPTAADVAKIKAAVLVHHGALDTRLAHDVAGLRQGS